MDNLELQPRKTLEVVADRDVWRLNLSAAVPVTLTDMSWL